jgi:hypothetical protein
MRALVALLAVCIPIACGGGDDDTSDAASPSTAKPAPTVLTDNAAGKACASDKECGSGRCFKEFSSTNLLGMMTSQTAPGGYCSFACKLNVDCGGGICVGAQGGGGLFANTNGASGASGQCMGRCDVSSQCRDGYRCVDLFGQPQNGEATSDTPSPNGSGSCQIAPATDKLSGEVVGSACTEDAACSGGRCLTTAAGGMTTYPGGYCTGRCLTDTDCGAGATCAPGLGGGTGTCYRGCATDVDCAREGYRCRARAGAPGGTAVRQCVPGSEPLADGIVGNACTGDTDCGGVAMSCTTTTRGAMGTTTTYPEGYCSARCIEDIDCGAGGVCVGGFAGIAAGNCYKACAADSACRTGYRCAATGFMVMGMAANGPTVCQVPPSPPAADADAGM